MLFQIKAGLKILSAQLDRRGTTSSWFFTTEQEMVVNYWKEVFSNSSLEPKTLVKELPEDGIEQCSKLVKKILELILCEVKSSSNDAWVFIRALEILLEAKHLKRIQLLERKVERLKPKKKLATKKPTAASKSPKSITTEKKDAYGD